MIKGIIIIVGIMLVELGMGFGMIYFKLKKDPEYQKMKKEKKEKEERE